MEGTVFSRTGPQRQLPTLSNLGPITQSLRMEVGQDDRQGISENPSTKSAVGMVAPEGLVMDREAGRSKVSNTAW